jgi:hypothetical protein
MKEHSIILVKQSIFMLLRHKSLYTRYQVRKKKKVDCTTLIVHTFVICYSEINYHLFILFIYMYLHLFYG